MSESAPEDPSFWEKHHLASSGGFLLAIGTLAGAGAAAAYRAHIKKIAEEIPLELDDEPDPEDLSDNS